MMRTGLPQPATFARLRQQLRQRFQIPCGYRVPAELLGPWQQKAKLPSRFAQFKDQVNRGILCRGGRASVIGIGHLDPPRLDGCWKSDPNLLAARRPIVSEMLEKLIIINGTHPFISERELRENPAQRY